MASVKSLGVHQPAGLQHAIAEQLLPAEPNPNLYTWGFYPDTQYDATGSEVQGEDELVTTRNSVIWSRGGVFRKSFGFELEKEPITQALLAYFPTSEDDEDTKTRGDRNKPGGTRAMSKALVVFLKSQAHIHFLAGTSHVVHMPFEVESACTTPCGVIIQRKARKDNTAPVTLKFPRVPPNSFVSSQISSVSHRTTQPTTTFSTEGLGRPRTLPLRLSSTLENMWDAPLETTDSHWPRLVCLTDPLLELGLVVHQPDRPNNERQGRGSSHSPFLDPAEEILHVEAVRHPRQPAGSALDHVTLAVTANRETNMYTVWRLTYIENEDYFVGKKKKKPKNNAARRRSSMQPGLNSGTATPLPPSFRESLGAPLPGKKQRKSEKPEKGLDNIAKSLEDKGGEVTRRQSRRVSSLLARADLSASHERSAFAEQSSSSAHPGGKRVDSHGGQRGRVSIGFGPGSLSGTYHRNLNSLREAPVNDLLDELRAGGDFEGFPNLGLDDHHFDGLKREMLFTKIREVPMDNANVRYSLSDKPARLQCKVYIIVGPPFAVDEEGRNQVMVCIQDQLDKKLLILGLHTQKQSTSGWAPQAANRTAPAGKEMIRVTFGDLRRAQNVVDSCRIFDGDQSVILILSNNMADQRELSIQAPWSHLTSISLPLLYYHNLNSLDYNGSHVNREVRNRRSIGIGFSGSHINAVCHGQSGGVVDIQDRDGKFHQIQIQLQPKVFQVRKVLDACRGILPPSHGEGMLAGWWHVMQWLEGQDIMVANSEWSSLVILLFATFFSLAHSNASKWETGTVQQHLQPAESRSPGREVSKFDQMQMFEAPNSSACPSWMQDKAWQWLLDEPSADGMNVNGGSRLSFISKHIRLAKRYMASSAAALAISPGGYLPTAVSKRDDVRDLKDAKSKDKRRIEAAWSIASALQLLLEEQKLDTMSPEFLSPGQADLRVIMCQISRWLCWYDLASLYAMGVQAEVDPRNDAELVLDFAFPNPANNIDVFGWIQSHLTGQNPDIFLTIADIYSAATKPESFKDRAWDTITPRTFMFQRFFWKIRPDSNHYEIVEALHECGFTPQVLETLPEAILTPLQDAIAMCQPRPPPNWPPELLELVKRTDVGLILKPGQPLRHTGANLLTPTHNATWDFRVLCQSVDEYNSVGYDEGEGTERQAVVRALFKDDRRLNEAQNLLSTHKPRVVHLDPRPQWTESEYLEKQKDLVATVATGTLAIPAGRGLLYYSLRFPLLTQKFFIGGFNLTCTVKPTNVTVGVDKSLFTEEKVNWAFFHQGVAGGLAISPHAKGIDTSWILYNKPGHDLSNRHAGFLLALGLNGHLKSVAKWVAFKYLTPKHTMTSIGLLLGLAASYMGTMDSLITRLLSVHVTRMLPRGAAELNLSHLTQTTGIMGVGLLYCNSQHRRMSEIMMSEIEHVDDEDEEDPLRNEGYRLAAGFALGLINLGKGTDLKGLHDMRLTEKLLTLASATKKVELVHVLDRSAAGAVMAIALVFMKSEDHIVARKVDIPDSVLQFDYIRPDILLLRTVARNLILWSRIESTFDWIKESLPREYSWRHRLTGLSKLQSKDLPFFSILTGLCWAISLRYAGSANTKVRDLLVHYLDQLIRIALLPADNFDAQLARGTVRMCMNMLALSAATVMAGTGDLVVLRRLRSLHGRDDPHTTYGSHLAAHLAIGSLFLSCGTATFGNNNLAIAALLIAFYPLFPANVQDNRAHLQAFRHFWVLATDPRCLVAKDVTTGQPVSIPVLIKLKKKKKEEEEEEEEGPMPERPGAGNKPPTDLRFKTPSKSPSTAQTIPGGPNGMSSTAENEEDLIIRKVTPTLLPPLDEIASVRTDASAQGYWDLELDFEGNPCLAKDFAKTQSLFLRRRPAHEGAFASTLHALGRDASVEGAAAAISAEVGGGGGGGTTTAGGKPDPLDWIFGLGALRDITHAERALVLDRLGGSGTDEADGASSAVDARLVLEASMEGWSRDGLLGLRLLFEWADRRGRPLTPLPATTQTDGRDERGDGAGKDRRKGSRGQAKGKESKTGTKDVGKVGERQQQQEQQQQQQQRVLVPSEESSWWLRDSVVKMLKGKAWLAGRED